MTFRDDHDAALARADALERELDHSKEARSEAEAKLADATIARDRLEAEVAELRAKSAPKPEPKPVGPQKDRSVAFVAVFALLIILIAGVAMALISSDGKKQKPEKPAPVTSECTLTTDPPGVEIYADDKYLGRTPLSKSREDWLIQGIAGKLRAEAAGYRTQQISVPVRNAACSSDVIRLLRQ